ncbi:MAG: helix-turn-helix transcriptional regulator [Planctomycetota bacterium]|jgi:AraC-like DNA-binding protein
MPTKDPEDIKYWTEPKMVVRLHSAWLKKRKPGQLTGNLHSHIYHEIIYVDHGKMKIGIGKKKEFILNTGDCMFLTASKKHSVAAPRGEACSFFNIMYRGRMPEELTESPFNISERTTDVLRELRLYIEPPFDSIKAELASCKLTEFLLLNCQERNAPVAPVERAPINRRRYRSSVVKKALDIIDEYYLQDLKVSDVAEEAGVSASHLRLLLRRESGSSFMHHLQNARIEHAKKLIQKGNININAIAYKVGYSSQPFFFKLFRKFTGMTPLEFAKTLGTPQDIGLRK